MLTDTFPVKTQSRQARTQNLNGQHREEERNSKASTGQHRISSRDCSIVGRRLRLCASHARVSCLVSRVLYPTFYCVSQLTYLCLTFAHT